MNIWFELVGMFAGLLVIISFLPNAIKTIKTKKTDHINAFQYTIYNGAVFCFMVYGLLIISFVGPQAWGAYGLIIPNGLILIMNSIVLWYMAKDRGYFQKKLS